MISSGPETSTTSGSSSRPTSRTPSRSSTRASPSRKTRAPECAERRCAAANRDAVSTSSSANPKPCRLSSSADLGPAPRGRVGEHAQGQPRGAQAAHGLGGTRKRPPRHAEHAVHVEQQPIDLVERHGHPEAIEPPCEWCRSRGSNPDAAEATGDFKSPASASSATPAREEYTTRRRAGQDWRGSAAAGPALSRAAASPPPGPAPRLRGCRPRCSAPRRGRRRGRPPGRSGRRRGSRPRAPSGCRADGRAARR